VRAFSLSAATLTMMLLIAVSALAQQPPAKPRALPTGFKEWRGDLDGMIERRVIRVLVLARPPRDEEARAAGADHYGLADYIQKIQGGWADIDVIIATPDVMGEVGKLGKILGPRGLMPNPKSGTVTNDVAKAVTEVKAGKIEFRVDKAGIVHASVGKANFETPKLVDNIHAFLTTVVRLKPPTAKGTYIKSISISSTMGQGVHVDRAQVAAH